MAFDNIPYALNSVPEIAPGVNGIALNSNAHLAGFVEQAYAFFAETGPYADDIGPKKRNAKAAGTAWKPNPTVGGFGVNLAGSTGYFAAPGHQIRPWSRECLFVYGATGAQALSGIAHAPGSDTYDRTLYVNSSNLIAAHIYDGGGKFVAGTTALTVGQAYHVLVTCSDSLMSIYLNGVLEGSTAVGNAGFQGYTTPQLVFGYGFAASGTPATTTNTIFYHIEYNSVLSAKDVRHRYLNQLEMFQAGQTPIIVGVVARSAAKATAWLLRTRGQKAAGWRIAARAAKAGSWRIFTRAAKSGAWRIFTRAAKSGAWRIFTRAAKSGAWRIFTRAANSASWRVIGRAARETAWSILNTLQAARAVAWRIAGRAAKPASWRVMTMTARAAAWRIVARGAQSAAWRIAGRAVTPSAWQVMARIGRPVIWRIFSRAGQAAAWRIAARGGAAAAWRISARRGVATAWRSVTRAAKALVWRVGPAPSTSADVHLFAIARPRHFNARAHARHFFATAPKR